MTASTSSYRVSLRLYVLFSVLMAVSAAASGLLLLYLARPFITAVGQQATRATILLFSGAGVAGALAAVAGLLVGLRFAGRIRGIVQRAEALTPASPNPEPQRVRDELGALDAAVGRLTLSMDQFVRDSDILARLPEGMLLVRRPDGELLSFNATAEALLAVELGRFRGSPLLGASGVFPLQKGNDALARLLGDVDRQGAVRMHELTVTTATGASLLLELTVQHREWNGGGAAMVLLFRDASEKQRIREEIRRTDQLALLGGMAARVAHEIRTPLSTIRGLIELLQADLPPSESRGEYMTRILHAVDRQDRLVENMLTLSNPEPESCQAVLLPALIDDVVRMLPDDRRISVHESEGASQPVWGDAFRLSEVFANLIQNALDATPPDGAVEVITAGTGPDRVRVSVRNTGAGIPADLRDRIFQPFFTTKSRGTGLGLAIARQIVEAHRGSLEVASDGTSETTFSVELPTRPPATDRIATRTTAGADG